MKLRTDYVSNSSSSSFIIAYDKKVFGNLEKFFKDYANQIGYSTHVSKIDEIFDFYKDDPYKPDWVDDLKKSVEEAKKNKKTIFCLGLDYEHGSMLDLLKFINNKNGGDKFEVLYGDDE